MRWLSFILSWLIPVAAHAMADYRPPVYGRPTLYGEYEINAADVARAARMYGDAPAPIQASRRGAATGAAKHPVRMKKVAAKKKSSKRVEKTVARNLKPVQETAPTVVADDAPAPETHDKVAVSTTTVAPPPPKTNIPQKYADSITGALSDAPRDVASYCTQIGARPSGKLPDGYILMPGRPDLMSCVEK